MTKIITNEILEIIDLNQIENYSITENQWSWLSKNRNLSEDFIEKFQDKVDWYMISCSKDFSDKFVSKYRDRLDMKEVNYKRNNRIKEVIENALK
jgi:hypothetical protein